MNREKISLPTRQAHLGAALRYVVLNPLRAGLTDQAVDWPWSSVHAHLGKIEDGITATAPIASRYPDFAALLAAGEEDEMLLRLRGPKALADRSAIPLFSTGWRSKAGARSNPPSVAQGRS